MTPQYTGRDETGLAAIQPTNLPVAVDGHVPVQGQSRPVEGVPGGGRGLEAGVPGVQSGLVDSQHLPGVARPHGPDEQAWRGGGPGGLDDR